MVIFGFEVFFELSWIERNGEVVSVTINFFLKSKKTARQQRAVFKWKFPEGVKAEEIFSLS